LHWTFAEPGGLRHRARAAALHSLSCMDGLFHATFGRLSAARRRRHATTRSRVLDGMLRVYHSCLFEHTPVARRASRGTGGDSVSSFLCRIFAGHGCQFVSPRAYPFLVLRNMYALHARHAPDVWRASRHGAASFVRACLRASCLTKPRHLATANTFAGDSRGRHARSGPPTPFSRFMLPTDLTLCHEDTSRGHLTPLYSPANTLAYRTLFYLSRV